MRLLTSLGLLVGALSSLFYFLDSHLDKFYIFDPAQLHELSLAAIDKFGNDTAAVVNFIVEDLSERHPKHVNLDEEWVFNNAGGAMGAMYIIHASVTEYLIIFGMLEIFFLLRASVSCFWSFVFFSPFSLSLHKPSLLLRTTIISLSFFTHSPNTPPTGTAIGTEGHTGRHTADDYFHILSGTQLAYAPGPGNYEAEVYPQGSVHHLHRGTVKQYKMDSKCFALEYARGWIPPMLGFGYADSKLIFGFFVVLDWGNADGGVAFTSTLDFPTLWRTTVVTGREMIGNLLVGKL
jgi:C-8 sterol isomerase